MGDKQGPTTIGREKQHAPFGNVEIICGDVFEILELYPDDYFDCVLTDPPYGSTQNEWDRALDPARMLRELLRVSRGAVAMTAIQPYASELVCAGKAWFRHEWVWAKNKGANHLNCKTAPLRYHETVLVFARGHHVYNPQMTTGHKPGNYAKRVTESSNYGAQKSTEYGGSTQRYPRSIQEFAVLNNDSPDRVHATQKPVELFDYLVRTYSNAGDRVLDPFAGSGTTGVAAHAADRSTTLIEGRADFCAGIRGRIFGDGL